ncbi:MAG TPA: tetratricopeptide repeat protein [Candidatus Marinimicrobia bacterium]|mgnify:CR=1 FL=1|nr:tetratricopeptide repeat protein [Candidatus Neomarinimicrobiota bacterium]HRU91880.1 tetratricopeptide repeat protein [Candidatus Neomarinimicrobiota bacterium]
MITLPILLSAQTFDSSRAVGTPNIMYDLGISIEPARESAPLPKGVANPNLVSIQNQIDSLFSAFSTMNHQIRLLDQANDSLQKKVDDLSKRIFLSPFANLTVPVQIYSRHEGERFWQKGQSAYQAKNYPVAIDYFLKVLASNMPDATIGDTYFWIGYCYIQLQDEYLAIEYLKKVAEYPLSEKLDDALFLTGITYQKLGNPHMAEIFFIRLLKRFPDGNLAKLADLELKRLKGTD